MFPKHRTDSLKGRPENGQISTNKEEEEVDVSQAQNGCIYILNDEAY